MLYARVRPAQKPDKLGAYLAIICGRKGCWGRLPNWRRTNLRQPGFFEMDGWRTTTEGIRKVRSGRQRSNRFGPSGEYPYRRMAAYASSGAGRLDLPVRIGCPKCGDWNVLRAEDFPEWARGILTRTTRAKAAKIGLNDKLEDADTR